MVCGDREYPAMEHVEEYLAKLPQGTVVMVSDRPGVDQVAGLVARARGLAVERAATDWSTGTHAVYACSARMVEQADHVVVFRSGGSPGTMFTIREAVSAGKPIHVFSPEWAPYPDGLAGSNYPGIGLAAPASAMADSRL